MNGKEIIVTFDHLSEHAQKTLSAREAGISNYAIFEHDNKLFVLAHGTAEGNIIIGQEIISPKDFLRDISCYLGSHKEVYTISCYGGKQKTAVVDGITIRSFHPASRPIYCCYKLGDSLKLSIAVSNFELLTWKQLGLMRSSENIKFN